MRYREPWSLFRRRFTPDGPAIWYYRTYNEYGHRTTAKTTGTTSKTLARDYCARLYREGRLIPTPDLLFEEYAKPLVDLGAMRVHPGPPGALRRRQARHFRAVRLRHA
jgi:hypothetical protein